MKLTFRSIIGYLAIILGFASIVVYTVVAEKSYFIGLKPGLELPIFLMYVFMLASLLHKINMIRGSKSMLAGSIACLTYLIFLLIMTSQPGVGDSGPWTLANYMSAVIFLGWLFIDMVDTLVLMFTRLIYR